MFLRRYDRRSNGKKRTYWALAESYRTEKGSRQRIVAYLGELTKSEQSGWAQLGRSLSGKQQPQRSLFDPPHYDEPEDDEPVLVDLSGIRLERLRDFGDVWMAFGLWRLLGLDTLLQKVAEPGREDVPWPTVAAILAIARFCRPSSELHIETTWYRGTALDDLLGVSPEYGKAQRVWVMDRGMVSEDNLGFLRQHQCKYIIGTPKAMLRQFEEYLTRKDWREVQAGVEVQLVPGPDGTETFVLARSKDRREKEKAMHQRFIDKLEAALKKMAVSAESGRLKDEAVAHRRLGRLMQQYWRSAKAFDVTVEPLSPPQGKVRLRVTWKRNDKWNDWAELSEGCYLLRTNLQETDPAVLWKHYIQLTEAEWAFRITKDELEIRPIWHQKEDRVLAHILVCFLAYVLWKTLGQWMQRSGLGSAPRTLLDELLKIKSGDVVLPTRSQAGHDRGNVRLRCVTEPDAAQKVLLNRLGIPLPRRLRRIDEVAELAQM